VQNLDSRENRSLRSQVLTPAGVCHLSNSLDTVSPLEIREHSRGAPLKSVFFADYLPPAAKKAGVHIDDGQRFGLHNLCHSLSNWLVNTARVERKTVQGILRHSKIQATLALYT